LFLRERSRKAHGTKPEEDLLDMPKARFDLEWDEDGAMADAAFDYDETEIVYDDEVDS
jgi:hypothetical protein